MFTFLLCKTLNNENMLLNSPAAYSTPAVKEREKNLESRFNERLINSSQMCRPDLYDRLQRGKFHSVHDVVDLRKLFPPSEFSLLENSIEIQV